METARKPPAKAAGTKAPAVKARRRTAAPDPGNNSRSKPKLTAADVVSARKGARVAEAKMGERRGSRRQKSFLRGVVNFDKRRGGMNCLIRDLSEDGARIILSHTVTIPEVIELHIPQRGQTLRARVQWRRADEIGLAFSEKTAAAPSPQEGELLQRIAQLEAEITTLRRTIKRLNRENAGDGEIEAA
jgi:PilZ domain